VDRVVSVYESQVVERIGKHSVHSLGRPCA
jgi:hypothetical protein